VDTDWRDEPALRELSEVLRERIGEEFRAEAEEAERLAAVAARRSRTLIDIATEMRSRGDSVVVTVGGRSVLGTISYVGADFIRLRVAGGSDSIDVNAAVPLTLAVSERQPSGGTDTEPGPTTFRARLLELELDGATVEIMTTDGDAAAGLLRAVGRDHVLVATPDSECFVALSALATVRRVMG
jgi:hypothetical protein